MRIFCFVLFCFTRLGLVTIIQIPQIRLINTPAFWNKGNLFYWKGNIQKEQVLVGDKLTISKDQAEKHFLKKVFEVKDPLNNLLYQGYATNPAAKCQANPTSSRCQR